MTASPAELWRIVDDEYQMATRERDAADDRYMRACLARIVLINDGFNVDYLIPRGPQS